MICLHEENREIQQSSANSFEMQLQLEGARARYDGSKQPLHIDMKQLLLHVAGLTIRKPAKFQNLCEIIAWPGGCEQSNSLTGTNQD